ncbi:MAG: tetraacyldisaccharide 4'-kinase, partial [Sinomicrobium sp.]|nr:tetraacyldisaccharide 4'-kinase [Sinomicrobium sp.]
AIARTKYLTDYLSGQVGTIRSLEFEDHHYFTKSDMGDLKRTFDQLSSPKKIIITTEKDAMRLESHRQFLVEQRLPIFVLPVQVQFHFNQGAEFDEQIKNFLLNFKV